MLKQVLLAAATQESMKSVVTANPVSNAIVNRFIAGEDAPSAVAMTVALASSGLHTTLDHLGESISDADDAAATVSAYQELCREIDRADVGDRTELSVKLSALGQALPRDGQQMATDNLLQICVAAATAGVSVSVDMEDHTSTDATLETVREVRRDFPDTGAVLQAYLRRTEADCRDLATAGSRVRLCKGAYAEPESVAYPSSREVDRAFVRCLRVLMEGPGYPMVATHDPRLIEIADSLIHRCERRPDSYEFQMLLGVRPAEQQRLASHGHRVRVYVPYGQQWYPYMMRRLAERPANLALALRAVTSRS